MRVALYARVSTHDQQTLPLQIEAMRQYVLTRGWEVTKEVTDISSGAKVRPEREALMKSARRRDIDVILVWRLDRWGRSLPDLVVSLKELSELGVGFLSLTEALDLTTSTGRAMAGLLAVFAEFERDILRERVKAGVAQSRAKGKPHGRPATTKTQSDKARQLWSEGKNKSQISRELGMSRSSVRLLLEDGTPQAENLPRKI
jgi:putative DNA-invertase from lambdoid prophage Rac